jgi:hypothetical protein
MVQGSQQGGALMNQPFMNHDRPDVGLIPSRFWIFQERDGCDFKSLIYAKCKYQQVAGPFPAAEFSHDPVLAVGNTINMFNRPALLWPDGSSTIQLPRFIRSRDVFLFEYKNSREYGLYILFKPDKLLPIENACIMNCPHITSGHQLMLLYPATSFAGALDWSPVYG